MPYYIFAQDSNNLEKLMGEAPSLEIAEKAARRLASASVPGHEIVSATVCQQDSSGEVVTLSVFYPR